MYNLSWPFPGAPPPRSEDAVQEEIMTAEAAAPAVAAENKAKGTKIARILEAIPNLNYLQSSTLQILWS